MATKAELEVENAELKAKIVSLEANVAAAPAVADPTVSQKIVDDLAKEVERLTVRLDTVNEQLSEEKSHSSELKKEIASLKASKSNLVEVSGDAVFVDGKLQKILDRNTAKEIGLQVLKRNLPEDSTCFVVERTGQ